MVTARVAREEWNQVRQQQFLVRALARRVIPWYNLGMKTAISLPDELFESADALAERLGLSRSELYATAVAEYLAKHRGENVTARLNEVFGDEPSGVDAELRSAQARSASSAEW
jgi:hypothetical protein